MYLFKAPQQILCLLSAMSMSDPYTYVNSVFPNKCDYFKDLIGVLDKV